MNPNSIFTWLFSQLCATALWNGLKRGLRKGGGRGGGGGVVAGAIKNWLSCQLKGSVVKIILSETGWRCASWRGGVGGGLWPVDCYDGPGRRAEGVFSAQKISGDKRWVRVAGQFRHHLMLFSETSERKQKVERREDKNVSNGGRCSRNSLSKWLRRHSALSENTSVEVKNNF